jgi:shikimate kinase
VYVIAGHACGGKTTASRYLAEKSDLILLDWDAQFPEYQALADPRHLPAMSRRPQFSAREEYFMRPPAEYAARLKAVMREQEEMIIAHLIRLGRRETGRSSWTVFSALSP